MRAVVVFFGLLALTLGFAQEDQDVEVPLLTYLPLAPDFYDLAQRQQTPAIPTELFITAAEQVPEVRRALDVEPDSATWQQWYGAVISAHEEARDPFTLPSPETAPVAIAAYEFGFPVTSAEAEFITSLPTTELWASLPEQQTFRAPLQGEESEWIRLDEEAFQALGTLRQILSDSEDEPSLLTGRVAVANETLEPFPNLRNRLTIEEFTPRAQKQQSVVPRGRR